MNVVDRDRWSEVEKLYNAALEREPSQRAALLEECPDEEVRSEVRSLLDHEQEGDRLLENPQWRAGLDSAPSLVVGTRLGPYEILEHIGRGGMGDVYRARDPRMGRDVAIKISSERFSERFSREVHAVAALNHPNICTIHDVGPNYLVMELVDGPTLAERIGSRAMKRGEALPIAQQIVEALEYAHEKGIIHRDLKPANVKLTADGKVKLLDFGLAKTLEGPPVVEGTATGVILGTAAYMAPEQAQGKPVDRRADIWAFGVVLYEMLTGKQLYTGDSAAEILAAVMKDAPNLDALPHDIRHVVRRCLCKDPHERWHSIGDVWITIEEAEEAELPKAGGRHPRRVFGLSLAAMLLIVLSALGFWLWRRSTPGALPLPVPVTTRIGFANAPSFSPDGKQIAYSWRSLDDQASSIYVKLIGAETELRVTTAQSQDLSPAWSPEGRLIAFYRDMPGHTGYYVVPALGGPVHQILAVTEAWPLGWRATGITWYPDGRSLAVVLRSGIASVNVETGEQKQLTEAKGALIDNCPAFSPDGRRLIFARYSDTADVYQSGADGGTARRMTSYRAYINGVTWTPDGRGLVFAMNHEGVSGLWRMAITGGAAQPIMSSVAEQLLTPTLSRQGDRLAYVVSTERTSLWRADIEETDPPRAGRPLRLVSSVRADDQPAYSRDGRKIAFVSSRFGPSEIWEVDADGRTAAQLTHVGGTNNGTPRWSPDGSQIAFDSRLDGNPEIMLVTEEGRKIRRITNNPAEDVVPSWSIDGRWIYFASNRNRDFQIYKIRSDQTESPSNVPVQVTTRGGFDAIESPDGKYLYYAKGRDKTGGLWRRQLEGGGETEEQVLASLQNWGWWALSPNGLFFFEIDGSSSTTKPHLKFLGTRSKRVTDLQSVEHPIDPFSTSLTVSPDGLHVLYEQVENFGSKIVMIENFR